MSSTNRTGRVSSIDYESGTYEVTYHDRGQSVTKKINAISNGEYMMPSIGQTVSVSHQSNGTAQATTTGTIWNETNKPVEGYEGLYRKEYSNSKGQAYERYDANTGVYTQYSDKRTGRQCNGEIYDEAAGPVSTIAGGQIQIQSTGFSVGIQADTGIGIVAGTTVSIEAGTSVSIEATGDMSLVSGGEMSQVYGGAYTLETADKVTETYKGAVSRTYKSTVTEEVTSAVKQTYKSTVTEEIAGAAKRTCKSTVTEEITGAVSRTYKSTVTEEVAGKVERTLLKGIEDTVTGDVTLTINGVTITINTSGDISITSPTKIDISAPEVNISGEGGDVTIGGVSLTTHTHADEGSGEPN